MLTSASQRTSVKHYIHICTRDEDDCNSTDVLTARVCSNHFTSLFILLQAYM